RAACRDVGGRATNAAAATVARNRLALLAAGIAGARISITSRRRRLLCKAARNVRLPDDQAFRTACNKAFANADKLTALAGGPRRARRGVAGLARRATHRCIGSTTAAAAHPPRA